MKNPSKSETMAAGSGGAGPDSHEGSIAFGAKLRAYRNSRKITLQQLADQSGVSSALLSQIERGLTSPSLRTLSKLRIALSLPSSFFFEEEPGYPQHLQDPSYICRAGDRPQLDLGPGAPHKELLHHGRSRVFEMMVVEIPARGDSGPDPISYPSEKGGLILKGSLELLVEGTSSVLNTGDSFLFDGLLPHRFLNPANEPTRLLLIIAKLRQPHSF